MKIPKPKRNGFTRSELRRMDREAREASRMARMARGPVQGCKIRGCGCRCGTEPKAEVRTPKGRLVAKARRGAGCAGAKAGDGKHCSTHSAGCHERC